MRQVKYKGKLGKDISLDGSQAAARLCYKCSKAKHTKVINCASDFLVQLFGEKRKTH
jgi:hypothetical protein